MTGIRSNETTITLAGGGSWDILAPSPARVRWPAVAASLAKQCRWTGHCGPFYSVAQHSVHVAELLPAGLRIYGLLHDAEEFATGNINRPMKRALAQLGAGEALDMIALSTKAAVIRAAGLPWPLPGDIAGQVKQADLVMEATERRDVVLECAPAHYPLPPGAGFKIKPWEWGQAEAIFTRELYKAMPLALQASPAWLDSVPIEGKVT